MYFYSEMQYTFSYGYWGAIFYHEVERCDK